MAKTYDPFKNVQDVMTKAMEIGHIDTTMFEIIKNPQRETKVYQRWYPLSPGLYLV